MFLTPEEIIDLSGYRRNAEQIAWLRKNGVKVYVRADGQPRVLRCDLERRPERRTVVEPNFGAMNGRAERTTNSLKGGVLISLKPMIGLAILTSDV